MSSFTSIPVSVSIRKQMYLLIHNSAADLSILSDFTTFKDSLDLVNKCFVTLNTPLNICGLDIKIRDTQLLAPGGSKSLQAVSSLYKDIPKIKISKSDISDMEGFWERDPESFKDYAVQDALITLIHGCRMASFNLDLGGIGVPVTLSTLSGRFLKNCWSEENYTGYQPSPTLLIGDTSNVQTPRGLFASNELGLKISMFIGNFKGGRNECFMYGTDTETIWYDYDIVSAYTTVMSMMGDPDYANLKMLSESDLHQMNKTEILYSYFIMKCKFKFPQTVKYPSIACFIDETTTVYPLSGSALLTGSEYLLALSQGCVFEISEIVYIPFKNFKPFLSSIKEIQRLRSQHPKGSILNALYKELGNSQYGLTARGISANKKFDLKLGKSVKLDVNEFANPLICSWITACIRSIAGELLHYLSTKSAKVVSVTTDGFITDYPNLESINNLQDFTDYSLFHQFCEMRNVLSGNPNGLELKHTVEGITS